MRLKIMKRILVFVVFLGLWYQALSQRFLGVAAFGMNLTQVDGDEIYGYKKPGFNVAASTMYPFAKHWYLSLEVAFSQKGAYQKYPFTEDPTRGLPFYNLRLDYVEIPFLLHFEDRKVAMLGAGISYNRLVRAKEIEWGVPTGTTARNGVYSIDDWNAMVDVRIRLWKSLRLNFRYAYSMRKIRTRHFSNIAGDEWYRDQYNNILTFRLVYTFNEIIPEEAGQTE